LNDSNLRILEGMDRLHRASIQQRDGRRLNRNLNLNRGQFEDRP